MKSLKILNFLQTTVNLNTTNTENQTLDCRTTSTIFHNLRPLETYEIKVSVLFYQNVNFLVICNEKHCCRWVLRLADRKTMKRKLKQKPRSQFLSCLI